MTGLEISMRTISPASHGTVTVHTQGAEALGESVLLHPYIERHMKTTAMFRSAAVDVVDRKKFPMGFATAGTRGSVVPEHLGAKCLLAFPIVLRATGARFAMLLHDVWSSQVFVQPRLRLRPLPVFPHILTVLLASFRRSGTGGADERLTPRGHGLAAAGAATRVVDRVALLASHRHQFTTAYAMARVT